MIGEISRKKQNRLNLPNRVIWFLTFSDSMGWGAYYAVVALIGIYLSRRFGVSAEQTVGIGLGIYLVSRSMSQIVIGSIADRLNTSKDELFFLGLGSILIGFPFLLYPSINTPEPYYILQIVIGIGAAMNLIGWRKLFASNLDPGQEGMDYGVYDSVYSLASAGISVLAGVVANINDDYFNLVVIVAGISIMLSAVWAIMIYKFKNH